MAYRISDLVEATGVAPRTIREYIARGMLPKPHGQASGALYDEEHLVRLRVISRMRAKGEGLDAIKAAIGPWSSKKIRAYLAEAEAEARAAEGAPANAAQSTAEGAASAPTEPRALPHGAAQSKSLERDGAADDPALPEGPRFVMAPLVPGVALLVSADAPPLVRRIVQEICERYGSAPRPRE